MPVFTSSIEVTADYPTIKPSLNFNFARSRALDSRVEFTRASNATYVGRDGLIKTAGQNEPRFDHDPTTGESLGLLLEYSRSNQFGHHNFSSGWALNNCSFATGISDPEGGTNARKLVVNSTNGSAAAFITDDTTLTSGTTYTQSFWAKANAGGNLYNAVQIAPSTGFTPAYRNFDLSNGTLGSGDIPESDCEIKKYPDGWYRVSVTREAIATGTGRMAIAIVNSPTDGRIPQITTGAASNDGIYIWGAQLEVGSFPTSLIKTSGGSASRSTEIAKVDQLVASGDITICSEYKLRMTSSNQWNRLFGFGEGSSDIRPFINSSGVINFYNYSTEFAVPWPVSQPDFDTPFKFAMAVRQGVANSVVIDGGSVATQSNTNPGAYVNWNELYLGWADAGNNPRNSTGHIKYFRVYNDSLTDAQLQLLTS